MGGMVKRGAGSILAIKQIISPTLFPIRSKRNETTVAADGRFWHGPIVTRGGLEIYRAARMANPADTLAALTFSKDEFIAAKSSSAGHSCQLKSARTIEIKNLVRLRYLEGIAANPIDDVTPATHAAILIVTSPGVKIIAWSQRQKRSQDRFRFFGRHGRDRKRSLQKGRQIIVGLLGPFPTSALAALIVVDRNEQFASRLHGQLRIVHRSPHVARMMQNTP